MKDINKHFDDLEKEKDRKMYERWDTYVALIFVALVICGCCYGFFKPIHL